jgi:hemoglobin-like flavoprotein
MTMNRRQIELVQSTFALAEPIAATVAEKFYQRLFELNPSLRALFKRSMKEQGTMLMSMLALVVKNLHQPETIIESVKRLGQRHVSYGVQPADYTVVGEALLWTLSQLFGPAFTPEVAEAWTAAYMLLAGVMQEATEPAYA